MGTRRPIGLLALAPLALLTACVMPDQITQVQKDLTQVQQELRAMRQDQSQTMSKLAELESRSADRPDNPITREELADLTFKVDESTRNTQIALERMTDLDRRLDRLTRGLEQTRQMAEIGRPVPLGSRDLSVPAGGPADDGTDAKARPAVDPSVVGDPETLYNTAYVDYQKGNFALAMSGFAEYEERYPESALADNAVYWIGECQFSQGGFDDALGTFDRLLERYPETDKAPSANLKKALAYREQNRTQEAIIQFRYVVSSYPSSDEAKLARHHLTSLGASI